jgi:hypothetical protein
MRLSYVLIAAAHSTKAAVYRPSCRAWRRSQGDEIFCELKNRFTLWSIIIR